MKKENLPLLLSRVIREAETLHIPIGKTEKDVFVNARAKRRFGCCRGRRNKTGEIVYRIEISEKVLECTEDKIRTILAHEILHTCYGCQNHGNKWKTYAEMMNRAYGYKISRVTSDAAMGIPAQPDRKEETVKYVLRCKKCGAVIQRKRACPLVRRPDRYLCGKCGGELEIVGKPPICSR